MYLLFEVGGSKTRVGISFDGKNLHSSQIIPTSKDFEQFIPKLKDIATVLSKGLGLKVIAGGFPGVLDPKRAVLVSAPHVPRWVGKPLKETLQAVFGVPTILENDTAFGALGEAIYGAGVGKSIVAYLTVGTGIGGARIVNGKIDAKTFGFEPGHQIISPEGLEFEQWISGTALGEEHGMSSENIEDPRIWDEAAKRLALGLTNTIVHWSPNILILGGGLMQKISLDRVRIYIRQYLKIFPTPPEVTLSKLGELSGLYGALEYLRQNP